jgi:hypothetical protein
LQQGEGQPEQRGELLDALSQLQNLLPQLGGVCEARYVQADHHRRRRSEPPTRRRARHTELRGDRHVPGASDKIPEPMIITSLRARRRFHAAIIGHSLTLLKS